MLSVRTRRNSVNDSVQNEPSTISQWRMPLSKDMAGRTEKLKLFEDAVIARDVSVGHIPFSTNNECFALRFTPLDGPCLTSVCRRAIHSAFIHKNELVCMVSANSIKIFKALFCTTFSRNFRDLDIEV